MQTIIKEVSVRIDSRKTVLEAVTSMRVALIDGSTVYMPLEQVYKLLHVIEELRQDRELSKADVAKALQMLQAQSELSL